MNISIKAYSLSQLSQLMKDMGQPSFRAKQIYEWLYIRHARSYADMTNLPAKLRENLSSYAPLNCPTILDKQISTDGTRKYLLQYEDGVFVETVGIPSHSGDRLTVCFSTQAGCAMACSFCATGKEGFIRNLLPGEIVDQVLVVQEDMDRRVTNVVGMGQGEPFLNYENVIEALHILNDPKGIGIGARHISVSTCGIIPSIEKFAEEPEQFTLAVSLHAAQQTVRDALMPKVVKFNLVDLKKALQTYVNKTNRRVTLEYIMIRGVNDTPEDLRALLSFCSNLLCHVNLIPINAIPNSPLQPSTTHTINSWINSIQKNGTEATLRNSRGSDIAGACGQLKNTRITQ